MKTPLVAIIFNRPEQAKNLRNCLKSEETRTLFVISDGPRKGKVRENELIDECRRIFSDWPSRVLFNNADKNLGCKIRISTGLNWVFENTDRAIILEDDCMPHPYFFEFCDELLEIYSEHDIVKSICGTKTFPQKSDKNCLVFTKYASSWGWATWKRAWMEYDDQFEYYSAREFIGTLRRNLGSLRAAIYWYYLLRKVQSGTINSWAYCWNISCFLRKGLHAYANENLVINSGFGETATHTVERLSYIPTNFGNNIPESLIVSPKIASCEEADKWIDNHIYSKSLVVRFKWALQKINRKMFSIRNDKFHQKCR